MAPAIGFVNSEDRWHVLQAAGLTPGPACRTGSRGRDVAMQNVRLVSGIEGRQSPEASRRRPPAGSVAPVRSTRSFKAPPSDELRRSLPSLFI